MLGSQTCASLMQCKHLVHSIGDDVVKDSCAKKHGWHFLYLAYN